MLVLATVYCVYVYGLTRKIGYKCTNVSAFSCCKYWCVDGVLLVWGS